MAYQLTFTLSDQEYTALIAKAEQTGKPLDLLLHEALAPFVAFPPKELNRMDEQDFLKYLQHHAVIMNIATMEPLSSEEVNELEELAQLFGGGKSASEMVIEDRGPR